MLSNRYQLINSYTILALGFLSLIVNNARANEMCHTVIGQIEAAQAQFENECGFDIMGERPAGPLDCGYGQETIGTAWNRALVEAGLPNTFEEREALAAELSLSPRASLILMGMARPEAITYLLDQLQICSGGD